MPPYTDCRDYQALVLALQQQTHEYPQIANQLVARVQAQLRAHCTRQHHQPFCPFSCPWAPPRDLAA